jgi:hypothetical protein
MVFQEFNKRATSPSKGEDSHCWLSLITKLHNTILSNSYSSLESSVSVIIFLNVLTVAAQFTASPRQLHGFV